MYFVVYQNISITIYVFSPKINSLLTTKNFVILSYELGSSPFDNNSVFPFSFHIQTQLMRCNCSRMWCKRQNLCRVTTSFPLLGLLKQLSVKATVAVCFVILKTPWLVVLSLDLDVGMSIYVARFKKLTLPSSWRIV